jgi:hypothetical protein
MRNVKLVGVAPGQRKKLSLSDNYWPLLSVSLLKISKYYLNLFKFRQLKTKGIEGIIFASKKHKTEKAKLQAIGGRLPAVIGGGPTAPEWEQAGKATGPRRNQELVSSL